MKPIGSVPMIELLLSSFARATEVAQIVIATSMDERNMSLGRHVSQLGYACEQGSDNDVLDRYVQAANKHQADVVVRITGDCPLVNPGLFDEVIRRFKASGADYFSNISQLTLPKAWTSKCAPSRRWNEPIRKLARHSTASMSRPMLRESRKFITAAMQHEWDLSGLSWTVG